MSDRMTPLTFEYLCEHLFTTGRTFVGRKPYRGEVAPIFGPAAGPHTQLAQNIVAAFGCGARFFELKTVQKIDGEDLPVQKPCIYAPNECYNVEWSTELTVEQAFCEYVKAYFAIKLFAREWGLSEQFHFNMSVGYDLRGIKGDKINGFIDGMTNAAQSEVFLQCKRYALSQLHRFKHVTGEYIEDVSPCVADSCTLSTLHGCKSEEIESIASHLITQKGLNTYIKCNPTLLGYERASELLRRIGYGHLDFKEHHFVDDLQPSQALPMFERLSKLAKSKSLSFGLKLTNTFPVLVQNGELPGEEMYMSGRPLFVLSLATAVLLAERTNHALSFSGGADEHNIKALLQGGIKSVTMATTLLKPGGYERLCSVAEQVASLDELPSGAQADVLEKLLEHTLQNPPAMPLKSVRRKADKALPLFGCEVAPCTLKCPISQDVPSYMRAAEQGDFDGAMGIILAKNPLPFTTGAICGHRCQDGCRQCFYDTSLAIRDVKLYSARHGKADVRVQGDNGKRVAVVGAGAAGLAAAHLAARAGAQVTVFEKQPQPGGILRYVIPDFRLPQATLDSDLALLKSLDVTFCYNTAIDSAEQLREYDAVVLAVGASVPVDIGIQQAIFAGEFLSQCRAKSFNTTAKSVVIIGAGNTAMDAARVATRLKGVQNVTIVYRRDIADMPADSEELQLAKADGARFLPFLSPIAYSNGKLTCAVTEYSGRGGDGRRSVRTTDKTCTVEADLIIAAAGERVDESFYDRFSARDDKRFAVVGDGDKGPCSVVDCIASATAAVQRLLGCEVTRDVAVPDTCDTERRRHITKPLSTHDEPSRCLACDVKCGCCVDVCPNRANVFVDTSFGRQVVHLDASCNECGNCEMFCPYDGAPYRQKFTVYDSKTDFEQGDNPGFVRGGVVARLYGTDGECMTVSIFQEKTLAELCAKVERFYY